MLRIAILNQATARRAKKLGEIGEALAEQILQNAGFTKIQNLNRIRKNFPFGDLYAERNSQKYVISVKSRNRFEARTCKLNSRYKLGKHCYKHAANAQAEFSAVPAFLAIPLFSKFYSAYFAPLSVLRGSRGIGMTPKELLRYECFAVDALHGFDVAELKNTYLEKHPQIRAKPSNSASTSDQPQCG